MTFDLDFSKNNSVVENHHKQRSKSVSRFGESTICVSQY